MTEKSGKVRIYNLEGKGRRSLLLPKVFTFHIRHDLIRRAVVALQSHKYQPQGRDPMAGKRTSAESYGVGYGMARIPRVKGRRHPKAGSGAFAPGTVGGRLAHPPKPEKKTYKILNKKERHLALKSAIAATADKNLVSGRGHLFDKGKKLPFIVTNEIESLNKTSETKQVLENLGVWKDVERVKNGIKVRPGRGKMRGRRKRTPIGPLIIVKEDKGIVKAARNIAGLNIIKIRNLNTEALAPGTHPGRLTIWSESAIKSIDELTNLS